MNIEHLSLRHDYSDHELADLSREISRSLANKGTFEKEFEGVRADFKARIASQEALISSLSARISSGFEMATVKCLLLDERESGYRLVVRSDWGHVVRRRKLEPHERQLTLEGEPPPEFVAMVTLVNVDETWPVAEVAVQVYQDEYDALKDLSDVKTMSVPPPKAAKKAKS